MGGLEIWLIAVSLAMDCLAISITTGIILQKIRWKIMLRMALAFGIFQAAMTFIGWAGASFFNKMIENVDHWIAFGLLCFIGIQMIRESFKKEEEKTFDPTKWSVTLMMAVATSIDAVAVGISFSLVGFSCNNGNIISASLIIGLVAFIISWIGLFGGFWGGKEFAKNIRAELWGGLILIGIGVKILVEHLCS
jgi:putative Mn2+ efflux pump MntP